MMALTIDFDHLSGVGPQGFMQLVHHQAFPSENLLRKDGETVRDVPRSKR